MKIFSIILFTDKRLPCWYVLHISIVFQASNDTMLVSVMSVCMSDSNKRNLKFSNPLLFADHDANSKVWEFYVWMGYASIIHKDRIVFSCNMSSIFTMVLI
jgi:hypothetical protein